MALAIFNRCSNLSHLKQLHAHLLAAGYLRSSANTSTRLLELCTALNISYAARLLPALPAASTNTWNALIRSLALSPVPAESVLWFRRMLRERRRVDALTCSFALKACGRALARPEAAQVQARVAKSGFGADVLLMTTLLDCYAKTGDLSSARDVFNEMRERDAASWNALIAGLAQGNRPREALGLFKRMKSEETGLRPDEVTVLGALSACSQLGDIRKAEELHAYIILENLGSNVTVSNAVIDMYAKCGSVEKAHTTFHGFRCPRSPVTWNTMIMALAIHGEVRRALELFWAMEMEVERDEVSYLGALCACNHAGMEDEAVALFGSMMAAGLTPNVKHYGIVIDSLGRAGRLWEAYDMVDHSSGRGGMPEAAAAVLWQTLLGACATYGDVEMAEAAWGKLAKMGSRDCGDFVLLSNVYAACGRWDDVRQVREAMRRRDMKKVPGFSYG